MNQVNPLVDEIKVFFLDFLLWTLSLYVFSKTIIIVTSHYLILQLNMLSLSEIF